MRRWLALAAAFVVAALVVWVIAGDWGDANNRKNAAPAGDSGRTGSGSPGPTPSPVIISGGDGSVAVGFNAAANNIIDPSEKTGGTLRLLAGSECDSWDPGRTSYGWCWNLQRLMSRTLVGYATVNGTQFRLAPDLATSLGRHNADYSRWTYTLQPGLRFSTGAPITPLDVKYGIERLFATAVVNGGPSAYFIDSIAHPENYAGPYKDGDLSSIRTTRHSITFYLALPNADFDHLMALPAAAPVPYRVEGGRGLRAGNYQNHPVASGPFEIQSHRLRKSITFVRNPYWRQGTDRIRHPLVDEVDLTLDRNLRDIDEKLKAGSADARADGGVPTGFQSQLLTDPDLKGHADDPVQAATQYLAVSPSVIRDVHCRRAIFYAADKLAAVRAFGGPTAGIPAKSMTPPGIDGYDPTYDPYPSGTAGLGDVAQAKRELRLCGRPKGFRTKFIYPTPSEFGPYLFLAERKALRRVGIKISEEPGGSEPYGCTEASLALLGRAGVGVVSRSLSAEYPTGSGFYAQVPAGFTCLEEHGTNLRRLHDPTVNRVLDAAPLGQASDNDWRALDHAVMASATYLPLTWEKTLYYRNPRLTNITCDNAVASGIYDFVNAGVN